MNPLPRHTPGRTYLLFFVAAAILIVLFFVLAQALDLPLLADPGPWMQQAGAASALLSAGLLGADVLLPVPSSILMTVNGRLFGFLAGAGVSLAGNLLAGVVAYGIGQWGGRRLNRSVTPEEGERAGRFLARWGMAALVLSRPIPVLAESVALTAGAAGMSRPAYYLGILTGSLPLSLVYAAAGAYARDLHTGLWIFLGVVLLSGLCWWVGRKQS